MPAPATFSFRDGTLQRSTVVIMRSNSQNQTDALRFRPRKQVQALIHTSRSETLPQLYKEACPAPTFFSAFTYLQLLIKGTAYTKSHQPQSLLFHDTLHKQVEYYTMYLAMPQPKRVRFALAADTVDKLELFAAYDTLYDGGCAEMSRASSPSSVYGVKPEYIKGSPGCCKLILDGTLRGC